MEKKRIFTLFLTVAAFFYAACDGVLLDNGDDGPGYGDYPKKHFWAYSQAEQQYYDVATQLLGEGDKSLVYVELGHSNMTASVAGRIASEFDNNIYPVITGAFGSIEDVDKNGKVILFLLDIRDANKNSYTAGYFNPGDMESGDHSNKADMLYMDITQQSPAGTGFYGTISHELQHLINYSMTVARGRAQKDLWINEGLSTAAEFIYNKTDSSDRIGCYNQDLLGTIVYGNNFFVWNGYWEDPANVPGFPAGARLDVLTNYTTAYLFFQWLRIHSISEDDPYGYMVYKYIMYHSKGNEESVVYSANMTMQDREYTDWNELFRDYLTANALDYNADISDTKSDAYKYGYRKQLTKALSEPHYFEASEDGGIAWGLHPGEAVYSKVEEEYGARLQDGSGTDIKYVWVSTGTAPKYTSGNTGAIFPNGAIVITYNSNKDTTGQGVQTGYVAPFSQSVNSSRSISFSLSALFGDGGEGIVQSARLNDALILKMKENAKKEFLAPVDFFPPVEYGVKDGK